MAHPDDIEFFCAGTLLLMTGRGVTVDFVLATSGDKGTAKATLTREELGTLREREQEAAAARLGAARVTFLRHPDAEVVESLEMRAQFVREIRRSRPDVLFTFDPSPQLKQHPDHRAVGRVALDAAWPCARDPLSYPTPDLAPHRTAEAWLFQTESPTLHVDVSPVLERKIEARLEHASQTGYAPALRRRWREVAAEERFVQVNLR